MPPDGLSLTEHPEPPAVGRPVRARAEVGQDADVRRQVVERGAVERPAVGVAGSLTNRRCGNKDERSDSIELLTPFAEQMDVAVISQDDGSLAE